MPKLKIIKLKYKSDNLEDLEWDIKYKNIISIVNINSNTKGEIIINLLCEV